MTIDDAIVSLELEFLEIAAHLPGEAIAALKPEIQQIACQYTPNDIIDKLQRNSHAPIPTWQHWVEELLLNLILEQQISSFPQFGNFNFLDRPLFLSI